MRELEDLTDEETKELNDALAHFNAIQSTLIGKLESAAYAMMQNGTDNPAYAMNRFRYYALSDQSLASEEELDKVIKKLNVVVPWA